MTGILMAALLAIFVVFCGTMIARAVTTEEESLAAASAASARRAGWATSAVVFIGVLATGFGNQLQVSNGSVVGVVTTIERKGVLWRTWEMTVAVAGGDGKSFSASIEHLSIDRSSDQILIVDELREANRSGSKVRIDFVKVWNAWEWRGETSEFATHVERLP